LKDHQDVSFPKLYTSSLNSVSKSRGRLFKPPLSLV